MREELLLLVIITCCHRPVVADLYAVLHISPEFEWYKPKNLLDELIYIWPIIPWLASAGKVITEGWMPPSDCIDSR